MSTGLKSLIECGTRLWLDSIDPVLVEENRRRGATGATSNPIIVADLIKTGRFDAEIQSLLKQGLSDEQVAWRVTDQLVSRAEAVFAPVHTQTHGDDGYVSFELDPLLEDATCPLSLSERAAQYVALGKQWAAGHANRMIKVPATPAGLACLEELAAAGITLNVTLIFSLRQYQAARDAVWRGALRRSDPRSLKSVYSIFVSRIDVYTATHVKALSPAAQGQVGIVNAQRIWQENHQWWGQHRLPRKQEIVFASTGTKDPALPPDKYVSALAGSDIQTNPPATNAAVEQLGLVYARRVDQPPALATQSEIDQQVDFARMEEVLMDEGLRKFADPQKALIALIASKRASMAG
ncbi:MAG: transaldolase [Planctomycetota bacterium]|nr:MAG: transaldolase [Planctomycetota bacterium]